MEKSIPMRDKRMLWAPKLSAARTARAYSGSEGYERIKINSIATEVAFF